MIDDDMTRAIGNDDLKAMVDDLLRDSKRRDEVIGRASSIIETINLENKALRSRLNEKTEQFDELKRNERALEAKLLAAQTEAHNIAKLRSVETKLRSEMEGLKHELELFDSDRASTEEALKSRLASLEADLELERKLKDNILKEVSDLTNSEKATNSLVEDYISQLRSVEEENGGLRVENEKLLVKMSMLEERHKAEVASMSAANKQMIDALRNRRDQGEYIVNDNSMAQAGKKAKVSSNKLLIESLNAVMDGFLGLDQLLGKLSDEELEEVTLVKSKLEESSKLLMSMKADTSDHSKISSLLDANDKLSDVILDQNDLIAEFMAFYQQSADNIEEVAVNLSEGVRKLAVDASDVVDASKRGFKAQSDLSLEQARGLQNDLKRIAELIIRNEERLGLQSGAIDKSPMEAVRELIGHVISLRTEQKRSNERIQELEGVRSEMLLKLEELVKELDMKNEEINEIVEEMGNIEAENERLTHKLSETEDGADERLRKANSRIDQLVIENTKLIKKIEDISMKDLHRDRNHMDDQRGSSREDRDLQYKCKTLQAELLNLQYKLKEKESEADTYKLQLENRRSKLEQLTIELGILKSKEDTLVRDMGTLRRENSELKENSRSEYGTRQNIGYDTFNNRTYGYHPPAELRLPRHETRYQPLVDRYSSAQKEGFDRARQEEDDLAEFEKNLMSNADFD